MSLNFNQPIFQQNNEDNIKCYLRCKPLSQSEKDLGAKCLSISSDNKTIEIDYSSSNKLETKKFNLDEIFDESVNQELIFNKLCLPLIHSLIQGYNCTIFAYGQTGAGKTHTILGPLESLYEKENINQGLIPRILSYIFNKDKVTSLIKESFKQDRTISSRNEEDNIDEMNINFNVKCSCLEIYQEHLLDLLVSNCTNENTNSNNFNDEKLIIREDPNTKSMYIENLTKVEVKDEQSAKLLLVNGMENRHVASTKMNSQSSRSHLIFTIFMEVILDKGNGKIIKRNSRLNVIDLAGSERQKATMAMGERIKEAGNINKSLSILGNVINALIDPKSKFVPFRDSKLTYLLKDSLGGNSKTVIIANISQNVVQLQETLSTLNFITRAKMIKNNSQINQEISDVQKISMLEDEIKKLKKIISENNMKVNNDNDEINRNSEKGEEYNELINTFNKFIKYEEEIFNKLKFLDIMNYKSYKSCSNKINFDAGMNKFIYQFNLSENKGENNDNLTNNLSYDNINSKENIMEIKSSILCSHSNVDKDEKYKDQNMISHSNLVELSNLHEKIKVYFNEKFNIQNIGENQLVLVNKNEYYKTKMKLAELTDSIEEIKKKNDSLESENFLLEMEMQHYKEDDEKNQNDIIEAENVHPTEINLKEVSEQVTEFNSFTPKKKIFDTLDSNKDNAKTVMLTPQSKIFLSNLKKSFKGNKSESISKSYNKKKNELLILKDNLDNALLALKDNEKIINDLKIKIDQLETNNNKYENEINNLKEENEDLNTINNIFKKDLLDLNNILKQKKKDIESIELSVQKNTWLIDELNYDYECFLDSIQQKLINKKKSNEERMIKYEKILFGLISDKKKLLTEINLLKENLNNNNSEINEFNLNNSKLRIFNKIQNAKAMKEMDILINYIFEHFAEFKKTSEFCHEKNVEGAVDILKNVVEKMELQKNYIESQCKENSNRNFNINRGNKINNVNNTIISNKGTMTRLNTTNKFKLARNNNIKYKSKSPVAKNK